MSEERSNACVAWGYAIHIGLQQLTPGRDTVRTFGKPVLLMMHQGFCRFNVGDGAAVGDGGGRANGPVKSDIVNFNTPLHPTL